MLIVGETCWEQERVFGNSVLSAQFCYESEAAPNSKAYLKEKKIEQLVLTKMFYLIIRLGSIMENFHDFISQVC